MSRRPRIVSALLAALAIALLAAPAADASRKPTPRERTLILQVAEENEATCLWVKPACVQYIRVSTKGPWAALYVHPPRGMKRLWQGGAASFHEIEPELWVFNSLASVTQGCGASKAVQRDLDIACG